MESISLIEGFERNRDITTAIRVQHRLGGAETSYTLTMAPVGRSVADTMWEALPDQTSFPVVGSL